MQAEELIMKYLGQDISSPEFWKSGLGIVDKAVTRLEELI